MNYKIKDLQNMSAVSNSKPFAPLRSSIVGYVDYCDSQRVSGWLIDLADVMQHLQLKVLIDDVEVCSGVADKYRQDLAANPAFANTFHAYNLEMPNILSDGKEHEVKVVEAETGYVLKNSPVKVLFPKLTDKSNAPRLDLALVGKNGWLFLCNDSNDAIGQYTGLLKLTSTVLKQYIDQYRKSQSTYRDQGIYYLLTITPGKESIYSEFLPDSVIAGKGLTVKDQFIAAVNPELDVDVLDLKPVLLANKSRGQLCYKNDSHWNYLGAMIACQVIIEKLREKFANIPEFDESAFTLIDGDEGICDLSGKTRLNYINGEYVDDVEHLEQSVAVCAIGVQYEKKALELLEHPYKELSKTRPTRLFKNKQSANLPRAIIVRDSYADWMIPFLSEYFSECLFVWARYVDQWVIDSFKPDIVIEQVVDRFLLNNKAHSMQSSLFLQDNLLSKPNITEDKKLIYLCSTGRAGSSVIMKVLGLNDAILMRDLPPYETRASQFLFANHISTEEKGLLGPVAFQGFKYSFCQGNDRDSIEWLARQQGSNFKAEHLNLIYSYYSFVASIQNKLDARYIIEKAVGINLSKLILGKCPDSKVIFSMRDPRDTFISMISHNTKLGYRAWGPDLSDEELFFNIIGYYPKIKELLIENPERVYILKYEDFICYPVNEIKNILKWLELKEDDSYINDAVSSMKQVDKFSHAHMTSGDNSINSISRWDNIKYQKYYELFKKYDTEIESMGYGKLNVR